MKEIHVVDGKKMVRTSADKEGSLVEGLLNEENTGL